MIYFWTKATQEEKQLEVGNPEHWVVNKLGVINGCARGGVKAHFVFAILYHFLTRPLSKTSIFMTSCQDLYHNFGPYQQQHENTQALEFHRD